MAILLTPLNTQKIEFNTSIAEGAAGPLLASRVTIVSGKVQFPITFISAGIDEQQQTASLKVLLDPTLAPGKFRKATAIVALADASFKASNMPAGTRWSIDDAQATLDDEAGRVQLIIDVTLFGSGVGTFVAVSVFNFQVTTLAIV